MSFKKIFFSYSRVDGSEFALKLAVDLKKQGFDVWIDQQDIRAGSEWDIEIGNALETCDCLLFLESEKSVSSNNVLDEVYYAMEQQKRVIPVIIHDSKTPYRLQRLQHIDFSTDYNLGLSHLVNELKESSNKMPEPVLDNIAVKEQTKPATTKKSTFLFIGAALLILILPAVFYLAGNKKSITTPVTNTEQALALGDVAGSWQLTGVEPAATLGQGYLKIEATDTKKLDISSSFQFYYTQNNDTLFLSVFNGLAGCKNCELQQEMKLVTEDAAIGSQKYSVLKTNVPGKGKAGDTVANQGFNQSIKASSILQFTDSKNAVIKVQSREAVTLNSGLVLEPFVYSFRFKKAE